MISLGVLVLLAFAHYVADFICQKDEWAKNKWISAPHLGVHVATYTVIMWVWGIAASAFWRLSPHTTSTWALANGVLHYGTDFITSFHTHNAFERKNYRRGFLIIGFDQFIHMVCLFGLWVALVK